MHEIQVSDEASRHFELELVEQGTRLVGWPNRSLVVESSQTALERTCCPTSKNDDDDDDYRISSLLVVQTWKTIEYIYTMIRMQSSMQQPRAVWFWKPPGTKTVSWISATKIATKIATTGTRRLWIQSFGLWYHCTYISPGYDYIHACVWSKFPHMVYIREWCQNTFKSLISISGNYPWHKINNISYIACTYTETHVAPIWVETQDTF